MPGFQALGLGRARPFQALDHGQRPPPDHHTTRDRGTGDRPVSDGVTDAVAHS